MKKYVKPMMESEIFVANEFTAMCYKITCNVDAGVLNTVYNEDNNLPGLQLESTTIDGVTYKGDTPQDWIKLTSSCGNVKGVEINRDPYVNGYIVNFYSGNVTPVYYWYTESDWHLNGRKFHATDMTKNNGIGSWEKGPNHS